MGGVGSGRYKVLTDFQREVRKRRHDLRWKKKNPEYMKLYMRDWRAKNHEKSIAQNRQTKARHKHRMIEDAFERVMDKRDGFEPPPSPVKKKPNYKTDKFRERNRRKSRLYYEKNKEKCRALSAKSYHKNFEKNKAKKCENARKYYHKKKLEKQSLPTFVPSDVYEL